MINILLSTYNSEKYLKEQLNSILDQTFAEWLVIVRDDQSNDSTVEILNSYTLKYPDKFTIIKNGNVNLGPCKSFEKLLESAKDEYIMFCDHDDVWLSNKLELLVNKIKETENVFSNKPVLVHSDLYVVDNNLNIISESFWEYSNLKPEYSLDYKKIAIRNCVTGCSLIFNKKTIDYILPFPNFISMHDRWVAMVVAYYGRIAWINDKTVLYRQHENNVIGAQKNKSFISKVFNFNLIILFINNIIILKMLKKIDKRFSIFQFIYLKCSLR